MKKERMKIIPLTLSLFLLASIFAAGIIAEEDGTLSSNVVSVEVDGGEVIASDEVEILAEDELEEALPEYDEDIDELEEVKEAEEMEKEAIFYITRVTVGTGFIMKEDESDAEFFRGVWVVRRFSKGVSDLDNPNEGGIVSKRFGYVVVGVKDEKERFKLEMVNFSSESVMFSLLDKEGNVAGSLSIKPKRYDRITLWFGDLSINSGAYAGEWGVTAVSKTKIIKPQIVKPSKWNIFAFKKRKEAALKEKLQERLLEEEGLGDFVRENKGKLGNIRKIEAGKRIVRVERAKRIRERIIADKDLQSIEDLKIDRDDLKRAIEKRGEIKERIRKERLERIAKISDSD